MKEYFHVPEALKGLDVSAHHSNFTICPVCGTNKVAISVGVNAPPEKGATGMCMDCGGWFTTDDENGSLRWATEEEVSKLPEEQRTISLKAHFETTRQNN